MPPWRSVASAIAGAIVQRQRLYTGFAAVAVVAMAAIALNLSLGTSPEDFLLEVSPSGTPGRPPSSVLSAGNRLLVVFDAGRPLSPELASPILSHIKLRLEATAGIASVQTGPSSSERQFAEEYLPSNILLYVDPESLPAIADRLRSEAISENLAGAIEAPPGESGDSARRRRDPLGLAEAASSALRSWSLPRST